MTHEIATLEIKGKSYEFETRKSTIGADVIDIGTLYQETGFLTYDPGFTSTASCESSITYIDGDAGILLYRGYSIDELAVGCDFLDVSYLLLHGELPTSTEKKDFLTQVTHHTMVDEKLFSFFTGFQRDSHPMGILCSVVAALSTLYHDHMNLSKKEEREKACLRLIAKIPTIAAMAYKHHIGQPFVYPKNDLSYTENFLSMCFSVPSAPYTVNPIFAEALNRIFILHADHEQNASTATVRLAASSGANPFACIAAGIASLWGPLHGGANEAALAMIEEIGSVDRIPAYIARAKDKNDPFRLMGFGHRVYKNYDPRAKIMQKIAHDTLKEINTKENDLFAIAMELEKIALTDEYFKEKKLYPNIDFYSGITLKAIGFPTSMFTVLFALARTVGWVSHWKEMMEKPQKIGRPRQLYNGHVKRDFIPLKMM